MSYLKTIPPPPSKKVRMMSSLLSQTPTLENVQAFLRSRPEDVQKLSSHPNICVIRIVLAREWSNTSRYFWAVYCDIKNPQPIWGPVDPKQTLKHLRQHPPLEELDGMPCRYFAYDAPSHMDFAAHRPLVREHPLKLLPRSLEVVQKEIQMRHGLIKTKVYQDMWKLQSVSALLLVIDPADSNKVTLWVGVYHDGVSFFEDGMSPFPRTIEWGEGNRAEVCRFESCPQEYVLGIGARLEGHVMGGTWGGFVGTHPKFGVTCAHCMHPMEIECEWSCCGTPLSSTVDLAIVPISTDQPIQPARLPGVAPSFPQPQGGFIFQKKGAKTQVTTTVVVPPLGDIKCLLRFECIIPHHPKPYYNQLCAGQQCYDRDFGSTTLGRFAEKGDSGALIYHVDPSNNTAISCVGQVVGGDHDGIVFVTPWEALRAIMHQHNIPCEEIAFLQNNLQADE